LAIMGKANALAATPVVAPARRKCLLWVVMGKGS
jgi:hypothetical protein